MTWDLGATGHRAQLYGLGLVAPGFAQQGGSTIHPPRFAQQTGSTIHPAAGQDLVTTMAFIITITGSMRLSYGTDSHSHGARRQLE